MLAGGGGVRGARDLSQEKVLCGLCPDEQCRAKLFFPAYDSSIECTSCGQRHEQKALLEIAEVTNPQVALHNILRNILLGQHKPKMGPESVKVLGLSNYQCKILSPLLTVYGMDKKTGCAKTLQEMGQGDAFDCGILGTRAFLIEPDHIEINGYGRDRTGSMNYLKDTLEAIKKSNNHEECLLPIHADGDGHCLVHAISKALIGRELFWHALRTSLKTHFQTNLTTYKHLFTDFIDKDEWHDIIEECDPDYIPSFGEAVGLRNIHIFGLANILHRPIVLLDSISGIQSSGDYTGVFLPVLLPVDKCRSKEGELNKPLCLAWSSKGHNHYIALVGVKGRPVPRLPGWMMPSPWGAPRDTMAKYIDLDEEGGCKIGGLKCLGDKYVLRLVHAMEEVFHQNHSVSPALVADVHQYLYKAKGVVYAHPGLVIGDTKDAVRERRLFRCLTCEAMAMMVVMPESLLPGGYHYKLALDTYKKLDPAVNYSFPVDGLICRFDAEKDELVPDRDRSRPRQCLFCQGTQLRQVKGDGSICYLNGDRTTTRTSHSTCQCGFKHYWDGQEYDNLPQEFPVVLEWRDKSVKEKVVWFQNESDPANNSNVYTVAEKLVLKHFPGTFGSERLIQKVVDKILLQTAVLSTEETMDEGVEVDGSPQSPTEGAAAWDSTTPSKIILTGRAKQTLHKEELTKSETEKDIRRKVEEKAGQSQRRRTMEQSQQSQQPTVLSPTKVNPKLQKTGGSPTTKDPNTPTTPTAKVGDTPTTPSTPPHCPKQPTPSAPSTARKVRVSTSYGKQLQLTLGQPTTYAQLLAMLEVKLEISAEDRQRIRWGFPPRELRPPEAGHEADDVPLQHGDRIMVEVFRDSAPRPSVSQTASPCSEASHSPRHSQPSSLDSQEQQAAGLLQSLADMQSATTDIDTAISTLQIMASLTGTGLWETIQGMPKLFLPGGAYYEQFKRDFGMDESHNRHCTFPTLPGKIFRYNADSDVIEICLEPMGHFAIVPGVEERVWGRPATPITVWTNKSNIADLSSLESQKKATQDALRSGSRGVIVNPTMRTPTVHVPFSGKGHVMRDVATPSSPQGAGARAGPGAGAGSRTEGSPVVMDTTQSDQEAMVISEDEAPPSQFKRIGPGYTVLNASAQNSANQKTDRVNLIAETMEAMTEILTSIEEADTQKDMSETACDSTDSPAEPVCLSQDHKIEEEMVVVMQESINIPSGAVLVPPVTVATKMQSADSEPAVTMGSGSSDPEREDSSDMEGIQCKDSLEKG